MKRRIKNTEIKYRETKQVKKIIVFTNYNNMSFPICPTCKNSCNIEFQKFCSNCGQKLGWKKYYKEKVKIKYI